MGRRQTALAGGTRYKKAFEALRKAVELQPGLEKELPYKIGLPLGEIAAEILDLDQVTRQVLKDDPKIEPLLDLVFRDMWPTYGGMSDETRPIWVFTSVQTFFLPSVLPNLADQLRQTGAEKFAKAVEILLRQRFFERFKKEEGGKPAVIAATKQATKDPEAGLLALFLEDKGRLTLGQMEFVLRKAGAGKSRLFM